MPPRKKSAEQTHICDECAHGTYDTQFKNLSIYGKPTLIICEIVKHPKIVVGSTACDKFKTK